MAAKQACSHADERLDGGMKTEVFKIVDDYFACKSAPGGPERKLLCVTALLIGLASKLIPFVKN